MILHGISYQANWRCSLSEGRKEEAKRGKNNIFDIWFICKHDLKSEILHIAIIFVKRRNKNTTLTQIQTKLIIMFGVVCSLHLCTTFPSPCFVHVTSWILCKCTACSFVENTKIEPVCVYLCGCVHTHACAINVWYPGSVCLKTKIWFYEQIWQRRCKDTLGTMNFEKEIQKYHLQVDYRWHHNVDVTLEKVLG